MCTTRLPRRTSSNPSTLAVAERNQACPSPLPARLPHKISNSNNASVSLYWGVRRRREKNYSLAGPSPGYRAAAASSLGWGLSVALTVSASISRIQWRAKSSCADLVWFTSPPLGSSAVGGTSSGWHSKCTEGWVSVNLGVGQVAREDTRARGYRVTSEERGFGLAKP